MWHAELEKRVLEIQELVANNDLNEATKRTMDFVIDFCHDRKRKQESIFIRAEYNFVREQSIHFRGDDELQKARLKLMHSILEFVDIVREEAERKSLTEPKILEEPEAEGVPDTDMLQPSQAGSFYTGLKSKPISPGPNDLYNLTKSRPLAQDTVFYAKDLTKTYKSKTVHFTLHPFDLQLRLGEVTAVVGENGNGKTTLLNLVAGILAKDDGVVSYPYLGFSSKIDWYKLKQNIGYIPQELSPWRGKLVDNLILSTAAHGITGEYNIEDVDFIVSRLGLDSYRDATWGEISGGFKMRFQLARILLLRPKLVILDEPLANLDVNTQLLFLQDLRHLADSTGRPMGVIISSQHLHEVEEIADNIIFLKEGMLRYSGKTSDFGQDLPTNAFELAAEISEDRLKDVLEGINYVNIERAGSHFIIHTPRNIAGIQLLQHLLDNSVSLTYFRDISRSTRRLFGVPQ